LPMATRFIEVCPHNIFPTNCFVWEGLLLGRQPTMGAP
jgi:hypothetical protein